MSVNEQYSKFKPLIFVSGIYLLLIIIFSISDISEFKTMPPNAWGDFLAGTFAPLAFMWLVFGYRQQGEELKQNTEALRLQADELKNSVEQQKVLVETAKEELTLVQNKDSRQTRLETIQAQPYFHIEDLLLFVHQLDNEIQIQIHLNFKNSRALCRSLFFLYSLDDFEENHILAENHFDIVDGDHNKVYSTNLYILFNKDLIDFPKKIYLNFNYTDLYDALQIQSLSITLGDNIMEDSEDYIHQWFSKSFSP